MKKVGIIIALKREGKGYFESLETKQITEKPYQVFESSLDGIRLFIAISGLGKAYAAACTQFLIDRFEVDLIVNTGSCGSVCPQIELGDIICPPAIIEYDFKSIKLGTPVLISNKNFLNIGETFGVKGAVLGSADSNADTSEKKETLHRMGIQVADWEGASILKTAIKNNKEALILKVVTDKSSEKFVEEFLQNVSKFNKTLAEKTLLIIKGYQP